MLARMLSSRRLARMARTARARTLARYASAAGYLPHRFHVRATGAPEGAFRVRFVDGSRVGRADQYRAHRPAPLTAPATLPHGLTLAAGGVL